MRISVDSYEEGRSLAASLRAERTSVHIALGVDYRVCLSVEGQHYVERFVQVCGRTEDV